MPPVAACFEAAVCLGFHSRNISGLQACLFVKVSANYAVNFEIKFAFGQLSELPDVDNYLRFFGNASAVNQR